MADDTRGTTSPDTGSSTVTGRHEAQPAAAPQAPGNQSPAPQGYGNQAATTAAYGTQAPTEGYGSQAPGNLSPAASVQGNQAPGNREPMTEHERVGTTPAPVVHDRTGDRVEDRVADRTTHDPRDRDGDGRDDRTGAVLPGSAKEMAAAQRARYGGLHMGSAFFGWMSAVGIAVILLAILSAAGLAFGLYSTLGTAQDAADQADSGIGLGAAIALLVVLFIAYLAGGYVAGRMARFNGTKQGLGVWLWGVIVTVLAALAGLVLGTQYNVFDQLNLPALPVESGTATTAGLIALGAVLVVTLLGAMLGGKLGSHYHRKVDRAAFEPVDA
ncbi:hypothetical protein SAMN05660199_03098 [Klenkia soli]|uniref:Uncharacterized protein n=1 Tax=Klenkia soli TaxID=1052260 RepID=A0A1H0PHU5_9ACTN|nr:YrzE family protein [Klenkia soli]SDP04627.1 hypothetical protein SAMN05660199_03098 [Klenkia soli]